MKLESKLQISISKRPGNVILRREISNLGSPSQLSEALNRLMADGKLVRLGSGVFAKAHRCEDGAIEPDATPLTLAREVFDKLGVDVVVREVGRVGDAPMLILDAGSRRVQRKLHLKGSTIAYPGKQERLISRVELPEDVSRLPKSGVRDFVECLAKAHGVKHKPTGLDAFAEAVTRLSGDDAGLDGTGKLLVELKKRHIISNQQLSRLVTNYMAEGSDVRSIQGLRSPGLSA